MLAAVSALKEAGELKKWGAAAAELPPRRNVLLGELRLVRVRSDLGQTCLEWHPQIRMLQRAMMAATSHCQMLIPATHRSLAQVGIKDPEAIAKPSVRNDAAFLFSVVGSTSVIAVVLGQLPGDWGERWQVDVLPVCILGNHPCSSCS